MTEATWVEGNPRLPHPIFPYSASLPNKEIDKEIAAKCLKTMARPKGFEPLIARFVVWAKCLKSLGRVGIPAARSGIKRK